MNDEPFIDKCALHFYYPTKNHDRASFVEVSPHVYVNLSDESKEAWKKDILLVEAIWAEGVTDSTYSCLVHFHRAL